MFIVILIFRKGKKKTQKLGHYKLELCRQSDPDLTISYERQLFPSLEASTQGKHFITVMNSAQKLLNVTLNISLHSSMEIVGFQDSQDYELKHVNHLVCCQYFPNIATISISFGK